MAEPEKLVVHGRTGVTEIRLIGDVRADELLACWAARGGGAVVRSGALVTAEMDERQALRDGL